MAKYSRHDESVLQTATSKSKSLRTTVPAFLVNQFDLKKGAKLSWSIENGAVVLKVIQQEKKTMRS